MNVISGIDSKIAYLFQKAGRGYARHERAILRIATAIVMFFLTEKLLTLIPFFPYRWVVLISAISAVSALKSKSASFSITWLSVSLALLYQNPIFGITGFAFYLFILLFVKECRSLEYLIYTSALCLSFFGLEFFPIVLSGLIYGARKAVKVSMVTFFSLMFLCAMLPVSSLGHMTLSFPSSVVNKPPVAEVTLSNALSSLQTLTSPSYESELSSFIGNVVSGIFNSQLFFVLLIGWVLIAVVPAYVVELTKRYGYTVSLISLVASSYVPFLAVSYVYPYVPGFSPTAKNVLCFAAAIVASWIISEIVIAGVGFKISIERETVRDLQEVVNKTESESRIDALLKELERFDEKRGNKE